MKQLLITIAALVLVGCWQGMTIHHEAYFGNIERVEKLLNSGADINESDSIGMTVLDWALIAPDNNQEMILFLKSNGAVSAADKSIFIASRVGDLDAVKIHLKNGIDVNSIDENGNTPIYQSKNIEIFQYLIWNEANVNSVNLDGRTPLDDALWDLAMAETYVEAEVITLGEKAAMEDIVNLLRKHGGKTGEELKAEGK